MPTMKRRVLYIDDETWDRLTEIARGKGTTISGLMRLMAATTFPQGTSGDAGQASLPSPAPVVPQFDPAKYHSVPTRPKTDAERQAERDAILRRMNGGKG